MRRGWIAWGRLKMAADGEHRRRRWKLPSVVALSVSLALQGAAQTGSSGKIVYSSSGARWHIKGDGMICCPCKVPCPCRNNGRPSYGHCEATLWLRIRDGKYDTTDMSGMNVVETGGMCATSYRHLSALYFDEKTTPAQQTAYMKLVASLNPDRTAEFPYVRTAPFRAHIVGEHSFALTIPGVLEMVTDRNWGLPSAPMPKIAAADTLSNEIQYAENVRYHLHDDRAGLNFAYDGRQANYRVVDLDQDQYATKSMLIQFADGSGWFTAEQLKLIEQQKLALPDLEQIRVEATRLRRARQE